MNTSDHAIADREEPGSSSESELPPEPRLNLACDVESSDCDERWLSSHLESICGHIDREFHRVAVRVIDDAEMVDLHSRFHNDPTPTDVLTFEASDPGDPVDVDIAVCLDEARRNVVDRGHDVNRELLLYMLHGLLHCCGHDDHDAESHARMHAEEDRILVAIGVGPVFGGDA
jgi:probable rRNA maturation factor